VCGCVGRSRAAKPTRRDGSPQELPFAHSAADLLFASEVIQSDVSCEALAKREGVSMSEIAIRRRNGSEAPKADAAANCRSARPPDGPAQGENRAQAGSGTAAGVQLGMVILTSSDNRNDVHGVRHDSAARRVEA